MFNHLIHIRCSISTATIFYFYFLKQMKGNSLQKNENKAPPIATILQGSGHLSTAHQALVVECTLPQPNHFFCLQPILLIITFFSRIRGLSSPPPVGSTMIPQSFSYKVEASIPVKISNCSYLETRFPPIKNI
jgi:hypothetical protein